MPINPAFGLQSLIIHKGERTMTKYKTRTMNVREFRYFLGGFDPDERLKLMFLDDLATGTVDFARSVREAFEATGQQDDDDPVLLSSPSGVLGVWGFVSSRPPVLCCSLTSDSIQNN